MNRSPGSAVNWFHGPARRFEDRKLATSLGLQGVPVQAPGVEKCVQDVCRNPMAWDGPSHGRARRSRVRRHAPSKISKSQVEVRPMSLYGGFHVTRTCENLKRVMMDRSVSSA